MRDHSGLVVDNFRGDFNRGEDESVPLGYFLSSQNLSFIKNGVKTRFGSALDVTKDSVRRVAIYSRTGEAKRLLILDNAYHIYDSTNPTVAILTITGMTDFSCVTLYGRAYITPHNGVTGLPGEKVYVYDGTTARAAAGAGPGMPTAMIGFDGGSGNIEPGTRVFAVGFESASGYISKIGAFVAVTSVGENAISFSSLPRGPAGTVARIFFSTKELIDYNGDYSNQTYYFVPNGRVGDNIATFVNDISFFDADLKDTANFLLEQFEIIPAGVGIGQVKGRMMVWGENANPDTIRFSTIAEPESFSEVDGFVLVNPGDMGGGIKNACEYRGQCIVFKSQRSYNILPTSDQPAFWEEPLEVDASVGTECHGLARAFDGGHIILDMLFVVGRTGLRLYNGIFHDDFILSYNIDDTWGRINPLYYHTIEIAIDTEKCLIYIAVPLDSETSPNSVLVCDYTEGLTQDAVRWTIWSFPTAVTTLTVEVIGNLPILKYGSVSGNIYAYDMTLRNDSGTAIDNWVEFSYLPPSEIDDIFNHYTGAKFKVKGDGTLLVTGKYPSGDTTATFSGQSITLAAQGRTKFSGFNVTSEICSVKARLNSASKYFTMTKYTLYTAPEWGDVD